MARLRRTAHRLIWLNPLAADPAYAPLTRGMQAALPHTDDLLAGNSLASLAALADLMEEISRERRSAGIVLAAGAGRRFGGAKQLARLDGRPLLAHVLDRAWAVPALDQIVVVLGAHGAAIRAEVDFEGVEVVECADWAEGQAASLRAGVAAAGAA